MAIVYRTEKLEAALAKLCGQLGGAQGAVIVSVEGFVVAAFEPQLAANGDNTDHNTTSPQVAAMAATLIALGERTLSTLGQGSLGRLLIEGGTGALLVMPASNRAAVALMMQNEAKFGLAFFALQQVSKEISAILEGDS